MNFDLNRVLRNSEHNKTCKSGQRTYDFDVVVAGAVVATWRRYLTTYELVDSISEYVLVRAPKEGDYNPDYHLRAKVERQADLAAVTEGLFASGRIPTIEESRARFAGWGRAILERRENKRTERLAQAQKEFATQLYDAIDAHLSDRTTCGKLRALLGEVDIRAKKMTDHDAECYARDYKYEVAPIEAFTTTLSYRAQS